MSGGEKPAQSPAQSPARPPSPAPAWGGALLAHKDLRMKLCRRGPMVYSVNDLFVGRSFDLYGEYAESELDVLRRFLGAGDTAVDAGANIGAHTVAMAQMVGPAGAVHAAEPLKRNFLILCANLCLNGLDNVAVHQAAFAAAPGSMGVAQVDWSRPGNFGGVSLKGLSDAKIARAAREEKVACVTVDSLGLAQCRLVKIDVEGMELDVLQGAAATVRRHRPVLYLENDRRQNSPALLAHLFGLGYRCFWHMAPLFNAANFFANPVNAFPGARKEGIRARNVLALPPGERLPYKAAVEIKSPEDWL
jgi:FkbM family methyltransferase